MSKIQYIVCLSLHGKQLTRRKRKGTDRDRDSLFFFSFYDLLAHISNVKMLMDKQFINTLTNNYSIN